jgi:hypothetical protein
MKSRVIRTGLAVAPLLLIGTAGSADAARVRYHYGPAGTNSSACDAGTASSERLSWFGTVREPYNARLPRPPQYLTYRQPYTGRPVTIPVALPEGTPRIEHRRQRIIYNYGSYTVEVQFLPDGSTDVIYNPGPFRCP